MDCLNSSNYEQRWGWVVNLVMFVGLAVKLGFLQWRGLENNIWSFWHKGLSPVYRCLRRRRVESKLKRRLPRVLFWASITMLWQRFFRAKLLMRMGLLINSLVDREVFSIRVLGGARFMARFVGLRDMCRVLEAEKPWLFRDDFVLEVDGTRHGHWVKPLHLVTMWVQLHNVPPLNMTDAVASAIGGLIGKVIKVDKDDGRDCIGRFLHIRVSFDIQELLMCGANVDFRDYGEIWIDFRYEGLPNYCLICGKVRHVTRCCKSEILGEEALEVDTDALYAFKRLDAKYNLRGNWHGVQFTSSG